MTAIFQGVAAKGVTRETGALFAGDIQAAVGLDRAHFTPDEFFGRHVVVVVVAASYEEVHLARSNRTNAH